MKKIYLLVSLVVSTLSFGQTTHLNESFNYADNTTLVSNGWVVNSAGANSIDVGAGNGLNYAGYNDVVGSITGAIPGNAAKVDNTGEDVGKTFTAAVTSGQIYYSFLLNVSNATAGYFINLGGSTSAFASRIFVKPSTLNATTHFNIGLSNTSAATFAATPTEFLLNTTYLVIVKYDVSAAGAGSIWVKSSGIPMTEAAAGTPEHTTTGTGQASIDRFCLRQYSATQNQTVDAVFVSSTWLGTAACALSLGAETATCDAITLAVDTYNVTIPFTGGNSGAYTLSSNVGTIGGDNPNTSATGNITITGITEGTTLNFSITGGCTLSKTVLSPNCKPINTLPLSEVFNYAPATTLNSTQMWTLANSGDDIVMEAGNLTYTGITSTGNRATFAGVGAESRTPFTSTTTGSVYARFLNSVTDLTGITVGGITYSALFTDNAGATTNARIWIRENAGQYQYGLSPNSTGASVVWSPNLYSVGTTQYLLFSYDFATNTLALFENPTLPSTANVSVSLNLTVALANIGGFMLRQDTALLTPITIVDELYIDTVVPDALILSRNNFNAISGLNIYPNPAKNFLNITSSSLEAKTVAIYNVLGAQVLTANVTNAPINIASLSKGVYVVKVTEEGKTATRKLVIE